MSITLPAGAADVKTQNAQATSFDYIQVVTERIFRN